MILTAATGLSILALGILRIAAVDQIWVESAYARRFAPAISILLTRLSGRIPFSLAELVVLCLPLLVAFRFARVFVSTLARRSRRTFSHRSGKRPSIVAELGYLAALTSFGAATFYGAWGLNYARPPLELRLGWHELADKGEANPTSSTTATSANSIELEALAEQLVEAANSSYVLIHGSVDMGRPSMLSLQTMAQPISAASLMGEPQLARHTLDAAIDEGFALAAEELALSPDFKLARGPAKAVAASTLMSHLGLAGFYFPWTGEANYNRDMPPFQLPQTIAHEKAHQRGIGGEDEANFLGYLASLRSSSDFARYSAQLFGQRQLLRELTALDREAVERLIASRHAGVQRDVDDANEYWRRFEGRPAEVQRDANDAYLRFNGVEEGIDAYALSTRLIVLYARANGGRAMGHLGDAEASGDQGLALEEVSAAEHAAGSLDNVSRPLVDSSASGVPASQVGGTRIEN